MKIALPSSEGKLDEHFGHCQYFTIFEIDDHNNIIAEEKLNPPAGCGCKSDVIPKLASLGVTTMLAGNMGQGAVNILQQHGIQVVRGASGDLRKAVEQFLKGTITDSGAGCDSHGDCEHH